MFSRSPFRHLLWLLLPLHACTDPTYVTVHVTTDVPCERLQGVTLTVGKLGALEDKVPTTRTAECNGNEIGTLTVVPSGEDDGEFAVRVIMGIERDVETCTSPAYGDGCVVARRGLRFLPGDSVELPIVMRQICNGIPCGPYDTCVRGSCVPATCKDSNTCTEDKLAENGGPVDGGPGDSGDASPLGPEAEPVSLVEPYCGLATALDPNAAWAIKRGCVTRAGVSRFHGPVEEGFESKVIDTAEWLSITVEDGARAWGVKQGLPTTLTLEQTPFARPVSFPGMPNSPALHPAILPAVVLFPHVNGLTLVPRTPSAPDFPKGDYTASVLFDGGTDNLLGAWVPYGTGSGPPSVFIMHDTSGDGTPAPKLRRIALGNPPAFTAGVPVVGTKYSDPAISPDGNTLYVASDKYVHAFDPKTATTKWSIPAETALIGLVDRKQNFDTLVFVRPDGAATGDWVLRTYTPAGPMASPDVVIVKGATAGALFQYSIALALIPDRADDLAIVSDGRDVYGIDLATRAVAWKTSGLPAVGNAELLSTPNVTYVATRGKLHAIAPADGKVIFTKDTQWGAPSDIAIGPGHTLYVAEPVAPYRAGPKR
jgi:hypothetical protein